MAEDVTSSTATHEAFSLEKLYHKTKYLVFLYIDQSDLFVYALC